MFEGQGANDCTFQRQKSAHFIGDQHDTIFVCQFQIEICWSRNLRFLFVVVARDFWAKWLFKRLQQRLVLEDLQKPGYFWPHRFTLKTEQRQDLEFSWIWANSSIWALNYFLKSHSNHNHDAWRLQDAKHNHNTIWLCFWISKLLPRNHFGRALLALPQTWPPRLMAFVHPDIKISYTPPSRFNHNAVSISVGASY